ncbi:MAG: dihydrodipicolinate synthase family protein [Acidimicrobiales bacterium]
MSINLNGLIPATVLPMNRAGQIDEAGLRRYIRWISAQTPVALAINVDTGEGPHLTHTERLRVLEVVKEETELPCVVGLPGPFTEAATSQAEDFKAAGADAALVFPIPAFLSTPLDAAIPLEYHRAIAGVGLPLIVFQLQPALSGVNYEPEVLVRLAELDGVVGMKEASFDARRYLTTQRIIECLPKYQQGAFTFLSGNDNFIYESFVLGGQGALMGFGAIMTAEQVAMIDAWRAGRVVEAAALGRRIQRLADVVFAPPVSSYRARLKEALVMLGVLEASYVRPPLLAVPSAERERLAQTLVEVGLVSEVAA